jgi:hypothetical protein
MTDRSAFTDDEWKTVLQGPTSAGMFVVTSERGGSIRESFSMAKAYTEARKQHGDSELLDTIVSTKPDVDRARAHSPEELKERTMQHLSDAVALLEDKATPEELEEYKRFIVGLAERVAEAHKGVTDSESSAIAEIAAALGTTPP